MRIHIAAALTLLGAALSPPAPAQTPQTGDRPASVGAAPMDPSKTIVANAAGAPDLATLVAAIRAARLDATLSGPGPFTLFAPTNAAFAALVGACWTRC